MSDIEINFNIPMSFFTLKLDGFLPVFRVGGHVLIEKFTGKTYLYKAVDLGTREITNLFYTKTRLTEEKYKSAADKMVALCEIGTEKPKAELKTGLELLIEKNRVIFTYVLTRYGYGIREKQIELASQMLTALRGMKISISEAAVGTGKTHAYIIAAVLQKLDGTNDFWIRNGYLLSNDFHADTPMPVVISTSSIALQRAITRDYIPEISRILLENRLIKRPLTCVVRKGKEHYLCDVRLKDYIPHADAKIRTTLGSLLDNGANLDLGDMDYLNAHAKKKICVTDNCNTQCPLRDTCRYLAFMKDAQSGRYDFQVCNHQYLLADLIRRNVGQRPLIPNYQAVIIDEAHKLEQAAQTMYGTAVSNKEIPSLAWHIKTLSFEDKKLTWSIKTFCDKLISLNTQLFSGLCAFMPHIDEMEDDTERFPTRIIGGVKTSLRSLRNSLDTLWERLSDNSDVSGHQESLRSYVLYTLQKLSERLEVFQSPDEIVYWLEMPKLTRKVTGEITLRCIPKNLGKYLKRDLWSKRFPVVLTSGTLSAAGSFEYIKKRIGLDLIPKGRLLETSKTPPFDYKNNCLLYISEVTPYPDNRKTRYINAISSEVERLITATHGHTAVLFTSYRVMEMVYEKIAGRKLGYPLFKLNRSGGGAIARFKNSGNGVLFASGSMWEGIDIPGDILSSLIIVKLPFQVPDPLSEYEREQYASDEEYKRLVILPDMLLKLKQGFGRLIRLESDTGVVAVLDSRARVGGAYRDAVLDALPPCRVTDSVKDVERFIQTVKNKDYFQEKGEKTDYDENTCL